MVVRRDRSRRKTKGGGGGWGGKKKHRGSGSRGGHGFAGSLGHNVVHFRMYNPDHIGKDGFARPVKALVEKKTVNICDIEKLAKNGSVDLTALGYSKLLSKGDVHAPLKVKVASFTERAKAKLEKAGGSIVQ